MFNKENYEAIRTKILLLLIAAALIVVIIKIDSFLSFNDKMLGLLQPVLYAIAFAYVINLISSRIEKFLCKIGKENKIYQKMVRPIAIVIALIILLIFFAFAVVSILPQLVSSLINLVNNLPTYLDSIQRQINILLHSFNITYRVDVLNSKLWSEYLPEITKFVSNKLPGLIDNFVSVTGVFANIFMGFMMCFYFLMDKEAFIRQMKKVVMAVFPKKTGLRIIEIGHHANLTFSQFLSGQMLEACILAGLFYIMLTLLNMPYALLISCMTGIMSFVPVVGAITAWIIGSFLIFAIDPFQALVFLITFQILSQFVSSVIYPIVVGNSVGLPGVWTLVAVFVGGGFFGFWGIILGVPTAAVLYTLFVDVVNKRLSEKKLKVTSDEVIEKR